MNRMHACTHTHTHNTQIDTPTSIFDMADFNRQDQFTNRLLRYIIPRSCNLMNASFTALDNF